MLSLIFNIVMVALVILSELTGFSYKAINIIVFYFAIPLIFCHLVDKLIENPVLKKGYSLVILVRLLTLPDFEVFSVKLFEQSVNFLKSFELIGWSYTTASVIICVVVPGLVLGTLVLLGRQKELQTE